MLSRHLEYRIVSHVLALVSADHATAHREIFAHISYFDITRNTGLPEVVVSVLSSHNAKKPVSEGFSMTKYAFAL